MRFITCASYHGSGSSAVTDLISEFDGVLSFGDQEFRFVHDTDGIADLEYHLVWNFNRLNSINAINRYLKRVNYHNGNIFSKKYRGIFGNAWEKCSHNYIKQLADVTYYGSRFDFLDSLDWIYYLERILYRLLRLTVWRNNPEREFTSKKGVIYCAHPSEEKFLRITREYIIQLFDAVRGDNDIVMADQIVSSSNTEGYLRYFDDIKVIIVDRDPRDAYVLGKYYWHDGIIPTEVEEYCKWFTCTRENGEHRKINSNQICFLWFEDLIYRYDETVAKLTDWLELDPAKHTRSKQIFNPEISIKNTRLWEKTKCDMSEIQYIEKNLRDYLYWSK